VGIFNQTGHPVCRTPIYIALQRVQASRKSLPGNAASGPIVKHSPSTVSGFRVFRVVPHLDGDGPSTFTACSGPFSWASAFLGRSRPGQKRRSSSRRCSGNAVLHDGGFCIRHDALRSSAAARSPLRRSPLVERAGKRGRVDFAHLEPFIVRFCCPASINCAPSRRARGWLWHVRTKARGETSLSRAYSPQR
jgi:hypothetical protein